MAREYQHNKTLPFWFPAVLLAICALIIAAFTLTCLPRALTVADEPHHVGRFIAERAANNTAHLANLGPKVVGSPAHRLALEHLLDQIAIIRAATHPAHLLEVSVQTANGSFPIGGMQSVYRDIRNVVVRLTPATAANASSASSTAALLLNSHFDTVPISDGAGDDTFMVAVQLEVLRVLASSYIAHRHAIVFLFNGAEETGLQGAHAFVRGHEWAPAVRAFINLDSSGAGGRELLFQVSPGAGWLARAYAQAAWHPMASVAVQELFAAGAVPSDTDYRIFTAVAGYAGIDLATTANAYVYHTRRDRPQAIEAGSYQSVGDNVLALARALASAERLSADDRRTGDGDGAGADDVVYFDFLGWWTITYTRNEAIAVNVGVSVVAVALTLLTVWSFARRNETAFAVMLCELALVAAIQLVAVAAAGGVLLLAAVVYDVAGRPMSWFSNVWLSAGLYGAPLVMVLLAAPAVYMAVYRRRLARRLHRHKEFETLMVVPRGQHVQLFGLAQGLLLVGVVLVMTACGWRAAYMAVVQLVFVGAAALVNLVTGWHLRDTRWVYVQLVGQVLPFLFYANQIVLLVPGLAAIQGRTGTAVNPELTIAAVVWALGWLAAGCLVPLVCMVRRPMWWLGAALLVWVAAVGVMFTPVGFPYREATSEQRFWIFHTDRTFHAGNGSADDAAAAAADRSESGYLMLGMDRNANRLIEDFVPGLANLTSTAELCSSHLFCGLPLYTSRMLHQALTSHWLPTNHSAHTHPAAIRTRLQLVGEPVDVSGSRRRYTFALSGPCQMNVYLSPLADNRLIGWRFVGDAEPSDAEPRATAYWQEGKRPTYLVFVSSGDDSSDQHTVEFSVDIEDKSRLGSSASLDIAVAGHYVHQRDMLSDEFRAFLATFPPWAHVTAWISSYDSWTF